MPQTPDIFPLADVAWKHPKYPWFCILPLEFGVNRDIHKHENSKFYVQTAINLQRKCLGTPDCKYTENMVIDFIWLNVKFIQTILYNFKWDMVLWKWPKCPQFMLRTWRQTLATQLTGLIQFLGDLPVDCTVKFGPYGKSHGCEKLMCNVFIFCWFYMIQLQSLWLLSGMCHLMKYFWQVIHTIDNM